MLSLGSFQAIVGETQSISNVSLVGLSFSDTSPDDLSNLLTLETLDNVRVDQALFDRYAAEFNAFDAIPGNTVTVVPEPSAIFLCTAAWILGWAFRQRRHARHVSIEQTRSRQVCHSTALPVDLSVLLRVIRASVVQNIRAATTPHSWLPKKTCCKKRAIRYSDHRYSKWA